MSTPTYIAAHLRGAEWTQISDDDWQRPGTYPDVHSWPVADLVRRSSEPHHDAPPEVPEPRSRPQITRTPGVVRRSLPSSPHLPRQPRQADLIRRVATMRDEQGMTFRDIAAVVGGGPPRVFYLYRQADKLACVKT